MDAARRWVERSCVGLLAFYSNVEQFDAAAGGDDAEFVLSTDAAGQAEAAVDEPAAARPGQADRDAIRPADEPAAQRWAPASSRPAEPVVPATAPVLPRHVAIVGDSQAHSLAINLPDGIGDTFVDHRRFARRVRRARLGSCAAARATGSRTRSRSARAGSRSGRQPPPRPTWHSS